VTFKSVLRTGTSSLVTVALPLPLGLDLEQDDASGIISVVAVSGSGSADGDNVKVGDIVRAVTAREKRMAYPQGQVALGGIGRPQLVTSFVPCPVGIPLDVVLDAVSSNADTAASHPDPLMTQPGLVTLLLERPNALIQKDITS
jgi:hypothetical protein